MPIGTLLRKQPGSISAMLFAPRKLAATHKLERNPDDCGRKRIACRCTKPHTVQCRQGTCRPRISVSYWPEPQIDSQQIGDDDVRHLANICRAKHQTSTPHMRAERGRHMSKLPSQYSPIGSQLRNSPGIIRGKRRAMQPMPVESHRFFVTHANQCSACICNIQKLRTACNDHARPRDTASCHAMPTASPTRQG